MMRRTFLPVLAVLVLGLVFAAPSAADPASSDLFKGAWKAIDLDGSRMTLAVSAGGPMRHVTLTDQYCQPFVFPCKAVGWGEVVDDYTMQVTARWQETHGLGRSDWWQSELTYDPSTGRLWWFDVPWYRADR